MADLALHIFLIVNPARVELTLRSLAFRSAKHVLFPDYPL